jgi:uncharacterized protein YhdP
MRTLKKNIAKNRSAGTKAHSPRTPLFWRVIKSLRMPLAIVIITLAIIFSLFRALTPWAKQYKGEVEHHLSVLLGQPVTINDLETSWYWFQPVLKMNEVTLSNGRDHVLKLNKLLVGINVLSSLWHWQIEPGVLYVSDVSLTIRQSQDHWDIDGLNHDKQSVSLDSTSYLPILTWVLNQQKIIIKKLSARIYFTDGTVIPLSDVNVTALNAYGHYRLKGSARLDQDTPTEFSVLADMQLNPNDLKHLSGHSYFSVKHVLPSQWQGFFPDTAYHVKRGEGDIELWVDLIKGRFLSLQTILDFKDVALTQAGQAKGHVVQTLHANLAMRTTAAGWQLTGDHITLGLDGVSWPENALMLNYSESQKSYSAFLKQISLESLRTLDIPWPSYILPILNRHPVGQLHDTQLVFKDSAFDYVLTRFVNVGWMGIDDIPSVSQLTGVLHWQPTEGRIELDSNNTQITPKGLPVVSFDQLNAAWDWKQLSNGLRVSMDRFVLSRSDLVLSAQGTLDEPGLPTANLRMMAEYSANDVKQWLNYVPSRFLKPKLEAWLKQDIHHIQKASGRVIVNGPLADFPFDKQPGEFSVNTYLTGVDLVFAPKWPLTRDIDAHLQVVNRTLDVDVFHADLQQVPIDTVHLAIHDLGLGHETLLVRGQLNAPADHMMAYVFSSPLKASFSKWKKMTLQNPLALDLNLEVPLYPESNRVIVRGLLTFDNNQATFHHALNEVTLDDLSGSMRFDEHGVTTSALHGTLSGDPVDITVQSIRQLKSYTEVHIKGATRMKLLRQTFPLPVFNVMDGPVTFDSVLKLSSNPNEMDHMTLTTSMKGVSVDLPAPLGKTAKEETPLTLSVDFNADKNIDVHLDYKGMSIQAHKLSKNEWAVAIKQPDVLAHLNYNSVTNTLSGRIEQLHLSNLALMNRAINSAKSNVRPSDIPNLNLVVDQLTLDNVELGAVSVSTTSTPTVFKINECKIKSPEYLLNVQGAWTQKGKKSSTAIQMDLQLSDLGKALARWKRIPAVEAHRGHITFEGQWPAALYDFSLETLSGQLKIMLKQGRITHLDKETEEKLGLGKLLSILSLQTIPRRLQLDFSDLSEGGYTFDEFKGSFLVKNGVMNTQDSYIDGPVAYASMKGDLDLVHHLYDVDLRVSPYIMASLPIVVTIAGGPIAGPIAGIATWVASKLINKGLQQISAYTYKVSGPWTDPVVQQVHIYRKKSGSS